MRFITGLLIGAVFAITMLASFTNNTHQTTANVMTNQITKVENEELMWMARNIYFEARNQSLAGMLAVGLVVKNRIIDGRYPNSVKNVVTQGKRDAKGNIILKQCQFSWYCDGKSDIPNVKEPAWERSQLAALAVLQDRVFDFTDGATHFHNGTVSPNWGYPKVAKIDDHAFYKRTP